MNSSTQAPERATAPVSASPRHRGTAAKPAQPERPPRTRTASVFSSIMTLAQSASLLCVDIVEGATFEQAQLAQRAVAARALLNQIALLTEIGLQDVGDDIPADEPDARAWLLPQAYHDAVTSGAQQ